MFLKEALLLIDRKIMKTKKQFTAILTSAFLSASALKAFADTAQFETQNADSGSIGSETILIYVIILLCLICGFLIYRMNRMKKTRTLVGDEALNEINYAYTNLKKAWIKIKEENKVLNKTISFLSNNISDLETANCELIKQKEKLVNNENRLLELQKKKEELFSIAIHDIKNPAAAIKSYVELLEGYDLNAIEQQEIVKYLIDSTEQIMQLAQSINRAVLGEEKEVNEKEDKESVSLHKIVKSIVSQNIGYANKKKVELINKTTQDTPNIEALKSKIDEVIFNLINNAIKFSPPETKVFIKSYFTENNVSLEVTDNGVGIAPEDLNKAFTKGGILTAKPTGDEESTGLGLWIVKKIIDEHYGEVWVDSKLNVGTTFGFRLPIKAAKN
ncbi:MAG: sensor histidine kinase [Ignavibacteriae bacterium]|nr:sensor histidine kinase [Ignavibacteriota bacterium]